MQRASILVDAAEKETDLSQTPRNDIERQTYLEALKKIAAARQSRRAILREIISAADELLDAAARPEIRLNSHRFTLIAYKLQTQMSPKVSGEEILEAVAFLDQLGRRLRMISGHTGDAPKMNLAVLNDTELQIIQAIKSCSKPLKTIEDIAAATPSKIEPDSQFRAYVAGLGRHGFINKPKGSSYAVIWDGELS